MSDVTNLDASEQPDQPPRVFVSYSDDSPAHAKRVLELAQWLRSHGVDAQIDQFEESPDEGWPRWIYKQIREAEFVLVIATPGYLRRCESDEPRADSSGSAAKFGSHLTLQELHEAGGRNRKFVPVLFGDDAIVESVPLPLRGATCYRMPDQRDDLYRRLTGQPKVQRVPLGVLKTFDDESLAEGDDEPYVPEPPVRKRASFDEQQADDSLRAVVNAGILEPERDLRRHRRRYSSKRQWLISIATFGAVFMAVGLFVGRRVLAPKAQPICRIQLTDSSGNVVDGIDRVDLELPSGHLIEVVVEDGRTLRFACPPSRVQAQAHVYLGVPTAASQVHESTESEVASRIDGRIELPAGVEIGDAVGQAELVNVIPARPIRARPPEPEPSPPEPVPEPRPPEPIPLEPTQLDPIQPGESTEIELNETAPIKYPAQRVPKITPISKNPELQAKLAAQTEQLQRCYARGLADNPALRGELIGDVRTDENGRVVGFTIVRTDFSRTSPDVAACIRKEIESWKLGRPKNQRANVERISIEFSPPAM